MPHGAELSLVFGAPTYLTNPSVSCKFTPTDQKVANAVGKLWADFAANRSSGYWPLYHDQSQQEMLIDERSKSEHYRTTFSDMWQAILFPSNASAKIKP